MRKTECLAMILAGGQGSRLGTLTRKLAKPAIPFGGKYRIIDFPLSNCHNSGLNTVGILTQYQPLALHRYIGAGGAWNLDRKDGGVFVLPPYAGEKGAEWYKGTADAIYQNINFIEMINPSYVLVLSGDHIYTMDYSVLLDYHKTKKAEATIGVIEVPWTEAPRFGIMAAADNGRITQFQEKPAQPMSNLASMGIYMFNWKFLKRSLEEDAKDLASSHDFGRTIIPKMLAGGHKLFAYPYAGYWKDVGTVESLWEANMDLLADHPALNLHDPAWRIYSVNPTRPPHYLAAGASVRCSLISEGAVIYGNVEHSVIFPGVQIGAGSSVRNSVIMSYTRIGKNVEIDRALIGRRCVIEDNAQIGMEQQDVIVISEGDVIERDTKIGGLVPQKQVG